MAIDEYYRHYKNIEKADKRWIIKGLVLTMKN